MLDIIYLITALVLFFIIGWYGWVAAIEAWREGDTTLGLVEWLIGPPQMVVPIGCGLFCLQLFSQICVGISGLFTVKGSGKI